MESPLTLLVDWFMDQPEAIQEEMIALVAPLHYEPTVKNGKEKALTNMMQSMESAGHLSKNVVLSKVITTAALIDYCLASRSSEKYWKKLFEEMEVTLAQGTRSGLPGSFLKKLPENLQARKDTWLITYASWQKLRSTSLSNLRISLFEQECLLGEVVTEANPYREERIGQEVIAELADKPEELLSLLALRKLIKQGYNRNDYTTFFCPPYSRSILSRCIGEDKA